MHRTLTSWSLKFVSLVLVALVAVTPAFGQAGGGDGGTGGGTGSGTGGDNDNGFFQPAGVEINPQGVLRVLQSDPRVTRMQLMAAKQSLPHQLANPSKLRKVSLTRLEKAVAHLVAQGKKPSMDMVAMAGLVRLEYVFFYPETGDIVIAGPSEGFGRDSVGRIVGVESGQPSLLLDDVIVALRAFGPKAKKGTVIGVSIDPTQEGLARMQHFLRARGGSLHSTGEIPHLLNSLQQALGLNEITIQGVPAGTHFAHVLTEADYRMKLIGIGLEPAPVPMTTYISRLSGTMSSSNALVRWYFVPDYQAISVSEDGNAMQMIGKGVKLVGEGELVDSDGNRRNTGKTNPASRAFTTDFTKKFNQIAMVQPVYAQLRNLVDLSIAAAYIQHSGMYEQSGWDLGMFGSEDQLPVEVFPAPRQVDTAINAVMNGGRLITPIGGGVAIQAKKALSQENIGTDKGGAISQTRSMIAVDELADGVWWWD